MAVTIPRESDELVPVVVTVDGTAVSSGVKYAIVAMGTRPTTFSDVSLDGDTTLVPVSGLDPGSYTVWIQVTAGSEVAVLDAGPLYIT